MKMKRQNIGELEELILLVVGILDKNAYGISVLEEVKIQTGRVLSISAIHSVLLRLEEKRLLKSWVGEKQMKEGEEEKGFLN